MPPRRARRRAPRRERRGGGICFFFWGGAERGKREEEVRKEEKREPLREGEKAFWPRWSACQAQAPSPSKTPKRIDHLKTTPRDRLFIFLLPITCPRDQQNRADELARAIIGTEVSWSTGRDRGNRIKICSPNGKDFFSYEESLLASTFLLPPSSSTLLLPQRCPKSSRRSCKAPFDTLARSRARGIVSETRKTTRKRAKIVGQMR